MKFSEFARLVHSDLYRHCAGKTGARMFLKALLNNPGFTYCFWLRACRYTRSRSLTIFTAYPLARLALRHCTFRFGISIPFNTAIGPGFYIGHFGGIVVVTHDVPDNAVVAGIPARVISHAGSVGYVEFTDYGSG